MVDMKQHNRLANALTQLKIQGIATHDASPSPAFLLTQPLNAHE